MKYKDNLISVVVPVYNVEKYLKRCIDSILAQTYKNFEIILVDDESPDNCPQICDQYAKQYKNISVIHQNNLTPGASEARNTGIESAKGKYITFIDSDDYVHNSMLEVLMTTLEDNKVSLSMCSYKKVDDSFSFKEGEFIKDDTFVINDFNAMNLLVDDQTTSAVWGKLYNIDLFSQVRFPVGKHNEDMFITPLLYKKSLRIGMSSQKLYYYNQEGESLCRSEFNINMLDMIDAINFWRKEIKSHYPRLIEKVDIHYFSTLFSKCQLIVLSKDNEINSIYKVYKKEILSNFKYILGSKYTTRNNVLKLIFLKLGLFKFFFKITNTYKSSI